MSGIWNHTTSYDIRKIHKPAVAATLDTTPAYVGVYVAICYAGAMTFSGVVIGPPLFGVVAEMAGSYGVAYAALIVPAALCLWLLYRNRTAFLPPAA